jgi:phosphoribosylformylglycinamidine synthase
MTAPIHRQLGLTDEEYSRVEEVLGRTPNRTELAMYAVMWSEHCSYKSSRIHLKELPSEGPHVLVGPGEGAGIIRVDDVAVAFRMESHNHPSFVEPVQGAATGIGGIVRDVLSVGARPIALFDPLRFGPLPVEGRVDEETAKKNRFLTEGVVSGISSYGNCIGIPTVGGEIGFEDSYSGNPLVNVMCIGVAPVDRIAKSSAEGVGNKVILMGSSTGRDGIGGVSVLASASFEESASEMRPSVQVGDPFTEKLLIEACLELLERGLIVGIQDLGGAGLSCATSETAANASTGMTVDLRKVALREDGMEPFEILISESQERMLAIVTPADVAEVLLVCEKWGLSAGVIGEVTEGDRLEVSLNGAPVASVPAASLGDGPLYDRPRREPDWISGLRTPDPASLDPPADLGAALLKILGSPNIASKRWAWEQYDTQVLLGTVEGPGHDAAILRIPGADSRIAVSTDGKGRFSLLDPYLGAVHTVAEAARNVSAVGAEPAAITNCLNFGDPTRPEVMWQFAETVRGVKDACLALGTPVTGGNVSFYNETKGSSIYPTPMIGMIGVLDADLDPPPLGFSEEGDIIMVVGATLGQLGGSEFARTILGTISGVVPSIDLELEKKTQTFIRSSIRSGLLKSVHDISEGGLGVALAESCVAGGIGAELDLGALPSMPAHLTLFDESASRYLISLGPGDLDKLIDDAGALESFEIGRVGGTALRIIGAFELSLDDLKTAYEDSFSEAMGYEPALRLT